MLQTIIFAILGQLATGLLLFIALVPPSKIGKGFPRFHVALALILWLIAAWGNFSTGFFVLQSFLILTFLFAWSNSIFYPLLTLSILSSLFFLFVSDFNRFGVNETLLFHVPPLLVLGASSVSMLLGHWYLVKPKLSITYLKRVTIALIVSLLFRCGLLIVELVTKQSQLAKMDFFSVYGFFFLQRIIFGLLFALIFSILTYFCVRIRSTQSATGILYVVVVFCLVGEVIASYLFQKTGILF